MPRPKIMLDPGHGGRDSGAIGPSGLKECDVVLNVCNHLAAYLYFADVYMTRWFNKELGPTENADLQVRCDLANAARVDFFISVHCNSSAEDAVHGAETYIYALGGEAEKLADYVQAELVAATGLVDREVRTANFHVLRKTTMPAVLMELGFISNQEEEKLLADGIFQAKCAEAIAAGVKKYLQDREKAAAAGNWQEDIMQWGRDNLGLDAGHLAGQTAEKWFVVAVAQRAVELAKREMLAELLQRLNNGEAE